MNHFPRPLLLGYIRADVLRCGTELPRVEAELEAFARSEEYSLGTIYVEKGATPGAFDALLTEAIRDEATWGVVVPDLCHVTADEQSVLRRHNGGAHTPILVANSSPRSGGPGVGSPTCARSAVPQH